MKEFEHSALPWVVDENGLAGYGDNGANFSIIDASGDAYEGTIATLALEHKLLDNGETDEYLIARANARLIVTAVNHHARLVEALREILDVEAMRKLETGYVGAFGEPRFVHSISEVLKRRLAAIKNARAVLTAIEAEAGR